MANEKKGLPQRIAAGEALLLAEIAPPLGGDPAPVRELARQLAGKVHAVGVSDNHHSVSMSALAAAALLAAEGAEPILHVITRDRNRIALVSEALGAQALGIRNLLCTSGEHQTLGTFREAKNVFDLDSVQLLQTYAGLASDNKLVGSGAIAGAGPFCLGGVASPYADPLELQVMRASKKAQAGAQFLITPPVFDFERFSQWWAEVTKCGLEKKTAIVAGIQPLCDAEKAKELAARRPSARVPAALLARLASKSGAAAQRAAGIEAALETVGQLKTLKGLRGFQVSADGDFAAAVEVIEKMR